MTQNQINYWKNVETERSNRAHEDINRRAQKSKSALEEEQQRLSKYETLANVTNAVAGKYSPTMLRAAEAAIIGKELGIDSGALSGKATGNMWTIDGRNISEEQKRYAEKKRQAEKEEDRKRGVRVSGSFGARR